MATGSPLRSERSKSLRRLAVGAILLFAALYSAEVLLRRFSYQYFMPDIYDFDPVTLIRLKPDLKLAHRSDDFNVEIRTDSHGWRSSREISPLKRPGSRRMLFSGDSVTFGWGVPGELAFPSLVEGMLKAGGRDTEVINLAVPNFSGYDVTARFKAEGLALSPDHACAVIFIRNDFSDNGLRYLGFQSPFYRRYGAAAIKAGLRLRHFLISGVGLYNRFLPEALQLRYLPYNGVNTVLGAVFAAAIRPPARSELEKIEDRISLECIDDYYAAAKAAGIKPFFIILDVDLAYPVPPGSSAARQRRGEIKKLLDGHFERKGMDYVDLIDELRALRPGLQALPGFAHDGHPTEAGHRLIAEALYNSAAFRRLIGAAPARTAGIPARRLP